MKMLLMVLSTLCSQDHPCVITIQDLNSVEPSVQICQKNGARYETCASFALKQIGSVEVTPKGDLPCHRK